MENHRGLSTGKTPVEWKDNSKSLKETYHSSPHCHTPIQQVLHNHLRHSPLSVHCKWNQSSNLELSPHYHTRKLDHLVQEGISTLTIRKMCRSMHLSIINKIKTKIMCVWEYQLTCILTRVSKDNRRMCVHHILIFFTVKQNCNGTSITPSILVLIVKIWLWEETKEKVACYNNPWRSETYVGTNSSCRPSCSPESSAIAYTSYT